MDLNEYCDFVTKLASKDSMQGLNAKLATAGLGMAGEAGEIADICKKILFHGLPFTEEIRQKLIKEASDIMWYMAFLCRNVLNVEIQDVIDANVAKLSERYKNLVFTNEEFMAKEMSKKD